MIDPDEERFLHRLVRAGWGRGRQFNYLLATAAAEFVEQHRSYPRSFRRLRDERGELIGIECLHDEA